MNFERLKTLRPKSEKLFDRIKSLLIFVLEDRTGLIVSGYK